MDCGLPENSSYSENKTSLTYTSDATFIDTGISMSILSKFVTDNLWQPFKHVRSFPQGIRNCYSIEVSKGKKYLIRASFNYGNYDSESEVPEFELHLGANLWDTMKLSDASIRLITEIIHTDKFYVYMYFAEVEKLQANQFRQFNISLNGQHWSGPDSPAYLESTTVYKTLPLTGEVEYEFLIYKAQNSSLPPIINALEVYRVNELPQLETNQDGVDAVKNIKSTYKIKRNWQGDPCAPEAYLWDGLNCNYNDSPRIISLNLSSNGLTGNISLYISNLSMLQFLDLSNNSLVGEVPSFLSKLPLLRGPDFTTENLVGYCNEGGLIYDYMDNGSLGELLSGSSTNFLNWERRLRVALDAAQGLEYLHNYCNPTIVHGNVKSSNILINDEFQVKLADFGLSRTIPNDEDPSVLISVARTPGYLDHEYSESKRLSEKTDVYSFEIVLLEMFTEGS
ncbi:hypothetical protein CRYUN_Cryun32bG0086000 [Craigia yunnanensis]